MTMPTLRPHPRPRRLARQYSHVRLVPSQPAPAPPDVEMYDWATEVEDDPTPARGIDRPYGGAA